MRPVRTPAGTPPDPLISGIMRLGKVWPKNIRPKGFRGKNLESKELADQFSRPLRPFAFAEFISRARAIME
jgi:hypothetical protein